MISPLIDGIRLIATSYCISIPHAEWTPQHSYLVCRALLQRGVFGGKAMLGTRLTRHKEAVNDGDHGVFSISHTQYGWLVLEDGTILDPVGCLQNTDDSGEPQYRIEYDSACYIDGIDPMTCDRSELPKHFSEDEIYRVKRGVMREICSRALGYTLQVEGLTMAEVVFLLNQPLSVFGGHSRMLYEHFMGLGLSRVMPISKVNVINPTLAKKLWEVFFVDTSESELTAILR